MAKPGPKKKRERKDNGQLPLPTSRTSAACSETRVLPMQLQIGDRLADETGEWEVASRPYVTKRREGRTRPRQEGRPARRHRATDLGRGRGRRGQAPCPFSPTSRSSSRKASPHGPLTGDTTKPAMATC
jgi:hypothetical protein